MEEIVTSVMQVAVYMRETSSASQEQSDAIEQVNQAVVQMDEVTQRNAMLPLLKKLRPQLKICKTRQFRSAT